VDSQQPRGREQRRKKFAARSSRKTLGDSRDIISLQERAPKEVKIPRKNSFDLCSFLGFNVGFASAHPPGATAFRHWASRIAEGA